MSKRFAYCKVSISPLRSEAKDQSEMVSQLLFGEIVTVEEISSPWCKITTYSDNYIGFADVKHLHFITEKEVNRWLDGITFLPDMIKEIDGPWGKQNIFKGSWIPFQIVDHFNIGPDKFLIGNHTVHTKKTNAYDLALEYLNAPYLWGGKTPFGIDCSGLTQMVFRFMDINLPRDASQQVEYGANVHFNDAGKGDVAFFCNQNDKIIHVGILNGEGSIIHASGQVRIDILTYKGIVHSETGLQTHTLHAIKRM